jgi:hypothetical protein
VLIPCLLATHGSSKDVHNAHRVAAEIQLKGEPPQANWRIFCLSRPNIGIFWRIFQLFSGD